jgi:hypothetical protein
MDLCDEIGSNGAPFSRRHIGVQNPGCWGHHFKKSLFGIMHWSTTFNEWLPAENTLVSAIDCINILDDTRPIGKQVASVGYDGVPFFRHGSELVYDYLAPSQVVLCQDEFKDKGTHVHTCMLGLRLHYGRDDDVETVC